MGTETDKQAIEREALAYFRGFVRAHWRGLAVLVLLSAVATAVGLAQPYLTKILIDDGILGGDVGVLYGVTAAIAGIGVLSFLLGWLSRQVHVGLSARILFAMREALFAHLSMLSPRFYARWPRGELIARLDGDIAEIQRFSTDSLLAVLNASLVLAGSLAFMLALNWRLAGIAFLVIPLQLVFLKVMRPRVEVLQRAMREKAAAITGWLVDALSGMKTIQGLGAMGRAQGHLMNLDADYRQELLRQQSVGHVTGGIPALLLSLATAAVFVIGGAWVIGGEMQLGTLVAFTAYLGRATGPVQTFLGLYVAWARVWVSMGRVWELQRERQDVLDPVEPVPLPEGGGALVLSGVGFAHPERAGRILDGLDLEIPAGAKIAVVGESGVGKSTLVDLLHRHYDPDEGRITLDGIDLRELSLGELRSAVAVVSADATLFTGTIARNLALASKGASEAEMREALERARIGSFVDSLPAGLETAIGSEGIDLSTGQRQRIVLARTLLRRPRVLILDEATSAVDAATAREIEAEIDRLFAGTTRIVISHHADRIGAAERVYELKGGKLAERAR